jgi:hypothetical protein
MGVPAAANRDVKRRAWPSGIGKSRTKADRFYEAFSTSAVPDYKVRIASPRSVTVKLNVFWQTCKHAKAPLRSDPNSFRKRHRPGSLPPQFSQFRALRPAVRKGSALPADSATIYSRWPHGRGKLEACPTWRNWPAPEHECYM